VTTTPLRLLALDLGAESGRAVVGTFDGSHLQIEEAHRFPNVPQRVGDTLHWDVLRLYGDVVSGLQLASAGGPLQTVGVDAWGVDFGLLDRRGRLLGNPVHYRDARTNGVLERTLERVSGEWVYASTGIQFMPINTLYQLAAMVDANDSHLRCAERLLLIPDLIHNFLSGSTVAEYTNATTTQCFDVRHGQWANELLATLNIPAHIFAEVVPPGTVLGSLRPEVAEDVAGAPLVVAPGTHDTASAVAATPLSSDGHTAFLSSGTWSLIGLELDQPIVSEAARTENLTNEGGVAGTIRLLKNVMGLWLVQEARRALGRTRSPLSYAELTALAQAAPPFTAFIDPDDERFLRPGDLLATVAALCRETHQPVPPDPGTLIRVLLESLALKYGWVMGQLQRVSGRSIGAVHAVGGGTNNGLLCQLTADATGVPVLAGPAEATAIGNLVVQAMAIGEVASLTQARELVARSFPARRYEPGAGQDWSAARRRFGQILRTGTQEGLVQS
jgi:rhamnulokinase